MLDQNCYAFNIKTKHHHVAKIYGLEKLRLWQEKQLKGAIQKVKKKEISFSGVQYSVIHVGH